MPQQETFFENEIDGRRIAVIKTYDQKLAREAFDAMDVSAHTRLWQSLDVDASHDPEDIPSSPDREDFLWEELSDAAREDGSVLSFFVVTEAHGARSESLYVSPDWPSAEAFAIGR